VRDNLSHLTNLYPIDSMMTNLWRVKLLFKAKIQPANSSNSHGGDERHNTEVDGQMHSRNAKIIDLVGKYLKKKKIQNGREMVKAESR
jgi:hypothetical protein